MSIEAVATVLNHSRATGRAKLVLIGIANHLGDQGAWPSISTLARYANASERSVKRDIQELMELGELRVELQSAPMNSQYKTNLYWITIPSGVTGEVSRGDSSGKSGVTPVGTQNININHKEPKRYATKIPDDFWPTKDLLDWQFEHFPEVDWKLETHKFIDYWNSVSGSKGNKTDWDATWRNWIRNNKKPKQASREEENKKAIREFLKNAKD
jgi:hypothetical protein